MLLDKKQKEIAKESLKDLIFICFSIVCLILIFLIVCFISVIF